MRDYEQTTANKQPRRLRGTVARQTEEAAVPSRPEPRVPMAPRIGSAALTSAHAAMLQRITAAHPSHARQALLQLQRQYGNRLQRQYGNRYMQRVAAVLRQADGQAEVHPDVAHSIQRA